MVGGVLMPTFSLTAIFGFLSNPIVVLGLALSGAWMWHAHDKSEAIKEFSRKATNERRAAVAEFVVDMSARNSKLREENAIEKGRIKTETITLLKEVTNYVTPLADSRCIVPAGFVQHYNAAWGLSALSGPTIGLIDQPSGVPLSRVESVNTDNAGAAREWRTEAIAWRNWYGINKVKHDAFAGATDAGAAKGKPSPVSAGQTVKP